MASEVKANKLSPSSGTDLTLGDASDTVIVPTGVTLNVVDDLGVAYGGTGLSSFTAGDILYATGSTTLAKLTKGAAEKVLSMNSGGALPEWTDVDLTALPTITVAKGGTNLSSFAAGDILYATGSTTLAKLAKGSDDDVLTLASGVPSWAASAGGGKVLQIVQMVKQDTTSINGTSYGDITGLSLAITPTAASSKILITGNINYGFQNDGWLKFQFDIDGGGYNDLTDYMGDAASNRHQCAIDIYQAAGAAGWSPMFLHTPSYTLTDVLTYQIQGVVSNGTYPLYINRDHSDTDTTAHGRAASTLVFMEIAA